MFDGSSDADAFADFTDELPLIGDKRPPSHPFPFCGSPASASSRLSTPEPAHQDLLNEGGTANVETVEAGTHDEPNQSGVSCVMGSEPPLTADDPPDDDRGQAASAVSGHLPDGSAVERSAKHGQETVNGPAVHIGPEPQATPASETPGQHAALPKESNGMLHWVFVLPRMMI